MAAGLRDRPLVFDDRADAARLLARALSAYRGRNALVLAIPRGAVPIGQIVAHELGGELDVVLVRKLGAPYSPEYAVGAVDESGWRWVSPAAAEAGASPHYLQEEQARQLEVLRQRRARYTPGRGMCDVAGRTVIVVDDGLATGATMVAALHSVRARGPARLVCAVPVASVQGIETVRPYCDEVVCVSVPEDFHAVGQHYRSFPQVEDDEVLRMLSPPRR
jgi:predicted phosphoribosyltransferase